MNYTATRTLIYKANICCSEIEDCTLPWTFGENSIDYVHMRWLLGSIIDWDTLFAEAFKTLKHGGWVESFEARAQVDSDHNLIPEDSCLQQLSRFFIEGGEKLGRTFLVFDHELQREAMQKAGFVDIQEKEIKASSHSSYTLEEPLEWLTVHD